MAPSHRRLSLILLLVLVLLVLPHPTPLAAQSEILVANLSNLDNGGVNDCGGDGCSLREAIRLANSRSGPNTIRFSVSGEILLTNNLPTLTDDGTTIDATAAAAPYAPTIRLNGVGLNANSANGLVIRSNNNIIRGLAIARVPLSTLTTADQNGAGIFIDNGDGNQIYNCWIGLSANGLSAESNGGYGVLIGYGASNNTIGANSARDRNVISGNLTGGVVVYSDSDAFFNENNLIDGNYIGPDITGAAKPIDADTEEVEAGVLIRAGARGTIVSNNVIGTFISASDAFRAAGVYVAGFGNDSPSNTRIPRNTRIIGNYLGVSQSGVAISNRIGVALGGGVYGPNSTVVGDPSVAGGGNVIAGNTRNAIDLPDTSFAWGDVSIAGNRIGLTAAGTPLANGSPAEPGSAGILVGINPTPTGGTAGRATIGPGNIIAASDLFGIRVRSGGHTIKGNLIGTDATGASSTLPGTAHGAASIFLENGQGVTVGGPAAADRNIIAFSNNIAGGGSFAILINPGAASISGCSGTCASSGHIIQGNYIGVGVGGVSALNSDSANRDGIRLVQTSGNLIRDNLIGGLSVGITFGLSAAGSSADNNTISGNKIGAPTGGELFFTNIPTTAELAGRAPRNLREGIKIVRGTGNRFENNLIAYNGSSSSGSNIYSGVRVGDSTATGPSTGAAGGNQFVGNRLVRNNERNLSSVGGGFTIDTATSVLLSQNTTQFHYGRGTFLFQNGNTNIAAPTSLALAPATPGQPALISGSTGCGAGCKVEIFTTSLSTETEEGPIYVTFGQTVAGGGFSFPLPFCQQYVTATVTDASNNSSSYSVALGPLAANACSTATFDLIQASPNERNVAPGSTTVYSHTLSHTAQVTLTYSLVFTSTRSWASGPALVTLPPGGNTIVPVTVSVPAGTAEGTADTTTVQAFLGNLGSNQVSGVTTARVPTITPATPQISGPLTQSQVVNGVTTFTHTVTNIGDLSGTFLVSQPVFSGTPPSGWLIRSLSPSLGSLNPNGTAQFSIEVETPGSPPSGNVSLSFQVSVQGASPPRVASMTDTINIPLVRDFSLTPDTLQTATTTVGSTVSFSYILTNTGNAADSFTLTTPAPEAPLTFAGVTTSRSLSNLPAGVAATITLRYSVPSGTTATTYGASFIAQASGTGAPASATRTMSINVVGGGSVTITPGAPVPASVGEAGGSVRFTNTVTNSGNAAAPITVSNTIGGLPAGWTASVPVADNTCTTTLNANATCTYVVEVTVPADADGGVTRLTTSAIADNSLNPDAPNITGEAELAVSVDIARGLDLAPDGQSSLVVPGDVISFSFTLTNTGNAPDSYDLSLSQSANPAWTLIYTPTGRLADVPRDGERTIEVNAVVPLGLFAGAENVLTLRAEGINGGPSRQVQAIVTIKSIILGDLEPDLRRNNVDAGATVDYSLTLTNTGTLRTSYSLDLADSLAGWTSELIGAVPELDPGVTTTLKIRVSAPLGAAAGITNTTTLSLLRPDGTGDPLDSESLETRIGPRFGISLTPNREVLVAPGSTLVVTHTLRNLGSEGGTFRLRAANALGWSTSVSPNEVSLGPDEEEVVNVTIRVAVAVSAGDIGEAAVFAELVADPEINARADTRLTIDLVADLDLEASQVRAVTPQSGQISLTSLNIRNNGSAADTVTLAVIGESNGWQVTLGSSQVRVPQYNSRSVTVRVTVPPNIASGTVKDLRVVARSAIDATVSDSVLLTLVYVVPPTPEELPPSKTYLPLVRR